LIYIGYDENWKKLIYKGIKTNYSVSNFGNVRNDKTGRILKQFIQNNGYYGFTISINNKPHSLKTARVVALLFIENDDPINKTEVNHRNGLCKNDNSEFNLEWVTPDENKEDAHTQNLYIGHVGELNPNAKHKNTMIELACLLMEENKLLPNEISNKTNVPITLLADIYWGSRWCSISKKYNVKNYDKLPVNSNRKYNEEMIKEACSLIDAGYTNKEIIKIVGVSRDCIKRLRSCKTFKHISCNYNFYKSKIRFND